MGFQIKKKRVNTILLELRLTLPRLVFRPLTISEAMLNPWKGPDIADLTITHYENCRDHLESAYPGYSYYDLCEEVDHQVELPSRIRDQAFNLLEYYDYVDVCKASGRSTYYSFREFSAIRWYVKQQRANMPKYKMAARALFIMLIVLTVLYRMFIAARIPDKDDIPQQYVRVYINLMVGEEIPRDFFTNKGGYTITTLTTVHHYLHDYYPLTIRKGNYRAKDFDYEVKKMNEWHHSGEEIVWDKNFTYITVPVIITKEDWLRGYWRDNNKSSKDENTETYNPVKNYIA